MIDFRAEIAVVTQPHRKKVILLSINKVNSHSVKDKFFIAWDMTKLGSKLITVSQNINCREYSVEILKNHHRSYSTSTMR